MGVDVGSAFGFVSAFCSLFCIVSTLPLTTFSFTVSDFESFPSSSRSSILFSPAFGNALELPAVGYALDLPAVGFALDCLLLASLLSACCWFRSSRGPRIRVVSFLLATDSLAMVPSLLPPASLCGGCDSVVRFWPSPTPQLSIAPLRDCCFADSALAPREGSLQQRGLLSVRIGCSFARYFSFTCSAEMSVTLVIVCFAVSVALRSAAIARLILTLLSCTRLVPTCSPCTRASPRL